MIEINGSYGEGGGQILRTSLSLSAITGKPIRIVNVRSMRQKPGLQPQHLMACLAVKEICDGEMQGAHLGSEFITFTPHAIKAGEFTFDIGTAGSVSLLAQTLIPVLLCANSASKITLIGGTHLPKSPGYDYFENIFVPSLTRFGVYINTKLHHIGYYPKGGGKIELEIQPQKLFGCENWKSDDKQFAIIRISRLPQHIAEREKAVLSQQQINDVAISLDDSLSPGNSLTLCKGFKGAYVLGEIGKSAENVAKDALTILNNQADADVDHHLADQLLIYAAEAKGNTRYVTSEITEHLKTNIYVISHFVDKTIMIEGKAIFITNS